ncbi:CheR family methyltransferase [Acidicapsa acidisoli]|uniref:CheR family methyltransferase n=1 Tax=Acidicapsa acidisoli TaxID=1615681 RepID=UPI0021E014D4|nr:protein-glutamate O-methyltransferase CheR [Acidicapsa acidisoli]
MNSNLFAKPLPAKPLSEPSAPASSPYTAAIDYAYLRQLVFEHTQNVLDPSRDYLFETRLSKLVRAHGLASIEALIQHLRLKRDPALERAVAEAMTINETSFYRDSRPFELLRTELLPALIENRRDTRTLRIWSAACSTGQEAYSTAMLLLEHFPHLANWNVRIEGTDISAEVIQRCQAGTYHRIEMNRGLPARNIVRFFQHHSQGDHGEHWSVKPELRNLCNFRQANLCSDTLPFSSRFDVIFLRNVMLYFSQESRKKLLINIHRLLASDGILFLGSSEQPADPTIWTSHLSGGTCYFRPRQPS